MFGGNDVVASLVRQAASEWNQFSSVKFDFGPASGWTNCLSPLRGYFEVRIGFAERGYWSVVGTDSETRLDSFAPSMNFFGFNRTYSDSRFSPATVAKEADRYHVATIKHEFGHALALLHEVQNPNLGCYGEIKWDGPENVFQIFARDPYHWSSDRVYRNLGFIANADPDYVAGPSDPQSIMMYSLPAEVFRRGQASPCRVDVNYEISAKDKQVVAKLYPPTVNSLAVNDSNLKGAPVRGIAAMAMPDEVSDVAKRIVVDLESNDPYIRRNARARLSHAIARLTPSEATALVKTTAVGSYRQQLGLAVAVNNAGPELALSLEARQVLSSRAKSETDPTLKRELSAAAKRQ